MRLRVSDARALPALVAHLVVQGFPAAAIGDGLLDSMFPAARRAVAWGGALDVWSAENGGVVVIPVGEEPW